MFIKALLRFPSIPWAFIGKYKKTLHGEFMDISSKNTFY